MPTKIIMHVHGAGTIQRWVCFVQLEPDNQCGNNSRIGRIQGNMVYACLLEHAHVLFQSADARRALPCWDEPAFKATFDVVLVVPKDRVALSNMVSACYI